MDERLNSASPFSLSFFRVGAAFLAKNYESNDDVLLIGDTGIQYAVFEEGDGQHHPTRSCQVKIHHAYVRLEPPPLEEEGGERWLTADS